jgi:hypothetical protein
MKDKNTYNSDITKEDLNILGEKELNLRNDAADDQLLKERTDDVDFTGKDLDVPGRNTTASQHRTSLKDEENQLYSQGSADNENLEQDELPDTQGNS